MTYNFPNSVTIIALGNVLRTYFPEVDEAEVKAAEAVIAESAQLKGKPKWLEVLHLLRDLESFLTLAAVTLGENGHLAIEPKDVQ